MADKYFFEKELTEKELHKHIIDYYNATQFLYNILWMTNNSLAMHYGIWDETIKNLNDAQINENKIIAERLNLGSSDIVMDAGCGICGTSIWMAKNLGCKAIGLTITEKQVQQAKKYIKKSKVERLVQVELKDFSKTDYPNESFTKIFGIESICYANKQEDFAKEAFRLLKSKGRFVRADGFLTTKEMTPNAKKLYGEWCEGWAVPGLSTINEYTQILKDVGFINIEVIAMTEKIIPSAHYMWWINIPLYIPFRILSAIKILPRTNYMDIVASLNQKDLFCKGITSYLIITADKP